MSARSWKEKATHWPVVVTLLVASFLALYLLADHFSFPVRKDERAFWPMALTFSHSLVPSSAVMRAYDLPQTPLPFLVFGDLEYLFHQGIWAGRLLNFALTFCCLLMILFAKGKDVDSSTLRSALGLCLCPYFLGVGIHLYTDPISIFFSLLGVALFLSERFLLSALCLAAALSSRQYMLAFPLALIAHALVEHPSGGGRERLWKVGAPAISCLALLGWILYWGGLAPAASIPHYKVPSAGLLTVFPQYSLYTLSCVGAYFVVLEAVLFPTDTKRWIFRFRHPGKEELMKLVLLVALFSLFPPLRNSPQTDAIPEMGFLDQFFRFFLTDALRLLVYFTLALIAAFRFRLLSLEGILVAANVAILAKGLAAWDKYALPLLVVLWWLRAKTDGLEWRASRPMSDETASALSRRETAASPSPVLR